MAWTVSGISNRRQHLFPGYLRAAPGVDRLVALPGLDPMGEIDQSMRIRLHLLVRDC